MSEPANDDTKPAITPGSSDARVVVVTGASRGIGYAVAKAFGAAGAHVIALARTSGALEELDDAIQSAGGSATLVPVDLKDHDAIDRMGLALYERFGRVDVLVGNAGVLGTITPLSHIKPKDFDTLVSVNITANYRLIRSMDPLLRASPAGRAVFLTSGMAHQAKPFWSGYAMSKAALDAMVATYASEMENTSVRVNLLNPGPVRTALRAKAIPGEDPSTLPMPDSVVEHVMRLTDVSFSQTGMVLNVPTNALVSATP
ncbi:MAG: SDR family NAD(P)-dependent oxidoreductase [Devosiaceae bacterium]